LLGHGCRFDSYFLESAQLSAQKIGRALPLNSHYSPALSCFLDKPALSIEWWSRTAAMIGGFWDSAVCWASDAALAASFRSDPVGVFQ